MEASRRRRSIWWRFWTYFVVNTFHTKLFSHVIIGIDHGRPGITATTPLWFIVRWVPVPDNKSLGCCCRNSLPTVIYPLTHWGRVTHICVGNLTIIGSDNGLSPGRRQAIIWTSAGILLIGPLGTNFSEILIGIQTFLLTKMHLKCRLRNGVHFVPASVC